MLTQMLQLVEDFLVGAAAVQRLAAFWGPVIPAPTFVAPLLAIGSIVGLALLTGLAVGSVATLLMALVALYLLLTEVFGIAIEFNAPGRA
jgi:hypothetical protein